MENFFTKAFENAPADVKESIYKDLILNNDSEYCSKLRCDYYKKVLNRVSNRENTDQFYNGVPHEEGQYFNGRQELSNQDFLALVLEYDEETEIATVEQRNKFSVGDIVEVFGPKTKVTSFEIKSILNDKEEYVFSASHAQEIVKIKNEYVDYEVVNYDMTLNNYGLSGSTISNYAGSNFNPMVDRWEEIADNNPDIIIVEGGRNDYNKNVPMGDLGTTDKGTMKGAVAYLLSSLQEKFPNTLIIGVTCWEVGGKQNEAGYYCSDYGRAFIQVCEELGIPYVNAMDSDAMGVYMTSSNYRGRFCLTAGDVSHLNEKGMKRVLPVFEKKIYDYYNAHLNPTQQ